MDRDGVNGVYNRPYESLYSRCFRWLGLWAEWQHVLENGANALKSTDGQILNGIRNRMAYWLSELALSEYTMDDVREEARMNGMDLDDMMMELPPVMDENYLYDADDILEKGARALPPCPGKKLWRVWLSIIFGLFPAARVHCSLAFSCI